MNNKGEVTQACLRICCLQTTDQSPGTNKTGFDVKNSNKNEN